MSGSDTNRDRPAWGWIGLTVAACAFIGVVPQSHAFEVVGVIDPVRASLRWQAGVAVAWAITAVPLARRWSLAEREGRALVGLLLLSVFVSIASAWLGYLLLETSGQYGRSVIVTEFTSGAMPTHALTATMLSLVGSWTSGRRQRARAADREAVLRAYAARAELDALRERMQPHFVLNALNTVAALARRGDSEAAGEVATDLGELLQFTLGTDDDLVAFDTERVIVERYVAIEQARFGDRLQVVWDLDPAVRTTHVPALAWQPLVENAVRHDLATHAPGGVLQLAAHRHTDHVLITVETRRHEPPALESEAQLARHAESAPFGGLGVGSATLERRLTLLYEGRAKVERVALAHGYRTTLRLPLATSATSAANHESFDA
jgi:hypothetical protein